MKLQEWVQAVDMDSRWLGAQCVCVCVCVCDYCAVVFRDEQEDRAGLQPRGEQCYVPGRDWRVENKFLYFTVSHKENLRGA